VLALGFVRRASGFDATYKVGLSHDDARLCRPHMQTARVHTIGSVICRWNGEVAPERVQVLLREVHVQLPQHELADCRARSIGADEEVEADSMSARTRIGIYRR
jgi:hypothetical protein